MIIYTWTILSCIHGIVKVHERLMPDLISRLTLGGSKPGTNLSARLNKNPSSPQYKSSNLTPSHAHKARSCSSLLENDEIIERQWIRSNCEALHPRRCSHALISWRDVLYI